MKTSKLQIGDTFYRIGHDKSYFTKNVVFMTNKTKFINKEVLNSCYIDDVRTPLRFDDEHRTWCRTLKEAKEICHAKHTHKCDTQNENEVYYEVIE